MGDEEREEIDELLEEDAGDDDMAGGGDGPREKKPERPDVPPPPAAATATAIPTCAVCGKAGTDVPLLYVGGRYYCMEHSKEVGVVAAPAPPPPPPDKPWHIHKLAPFDAIRKRVDGMNSLVQIQAGEGEDEVQMRTGDRIVVMLVKADGTRHRVFDRSMGAALLYIFDFKLSSWVQSSLAPHQSGRNITPLGYR